MIPSIVRLLIGFGGGFGAFWLAFNLKPTLLGLLAGGALLIASMLLSQAIFRVLVAPPPQGQAPGDRDSNPPS
ncbi:MAG: hypothetical protein AB7O43_14640 [Hyphomicrobiaceae bacterium]